MDQKEPVSPFQQLALANRMDYRFFYPQVSLICFIIGVLAMTFFEEKNLVILLFIGCLALTVIPLNNIWSLNSFKRTMQDLYPFFWESKAEFEIWYQNKEKYIFTLNSWQGILTNGIVIILGLFTVYQMGFPFRSQFCNILGILSFTGALSFSGFTVYTSFGLLFALREIVKRPVFFKMQHRDIYKLQNLYLYQTCFAVVFFLSSVCAVWQSPYGFNFEMRLWLLFAASYPLIIFSFSSYQIHILKSKFKNSDLNIINLEVKAKHEETKISEPLITEKKGLVIYGKIANIFEYDVFICHSSRDKPIIEDIIKNLKKEGITYWVDAEQVEFGDRIIKKIEEGIKKSRYIIPCLSRNFNSSNWTKDEYSAALNAELRDNLKRILPLKLDNCEDDDIPPLLRDRKRVEYLNKTEFNEFIQFLKDKK